MKNLDLNGHTIKFNIDSNLSFKTKLGGYITIFYIIIFFVFFYLFGRDSLEKKFPTGYSQIIPYALSDKNFNKNLEDNNFMSGFGTLDRSAKPIDITGYLYPIFKYKSYKWDKEGRIDRKTKVLPTIKCNNTNTNMEISAVNKTSTVPSAMTTTGKEIFIAKSATGLTPMTKRI